MYQILLFVLTMALLAVSYPVPAQSAPATSTMWWQCNGMEITLTYDKSVTPTGGCREGQYAYFKVGNQQKSFRLSGEQLYSVEPDGSSPKPVPNPWNVNLDGKCWKVEVVTIPQPGG